MKIHYNNGETEKMLDNIIAIQVIGANEPVTVITANGRELTISLNNIEMIIDSEFLNDKELKNA